MYIAYKLTFPDGNEYTGLVRNTDNHGSAEFNNEDLLRALDYYVFFPWHHGQGHFINVKPGSQITLYGGTSTLEYTFLTQLPSIK